MVGKVRPCSLVLAGPCKFCTAWAGLRLISFIQTTPRYPRSRGKRAVVSLVLLGDLKFTPSLIMYVLTRAIYLYLLLRRSDAVGISHHLCPPHLVPRSRTVHPSRRTSIKSREMFAFGAVRGGVTDPGSRHTAARAGEPHHLTPHLPCAAQNPAARLARPLTHQNCVPSAAARVGPAPERRPIYRTRPFSARSSEMFHLASNESMRDALQSPNATELASLSSTSHIPSLHRLAALL